MLQADINIRLETPKPKCFFFSLDAEKNFDQAKLKFLFGTLRLSFDIISFNGSAHPNRARKRQYDFSQL